MLWDLAVLWLPGRCWTDSFGTAGCTGVSTLRVCGGLVLWEWLGASALALCWPELSCWTDSSWYGELFRADRTSVAVLAWSAGVPFPCEA